MVTLTGANRSEDGTCFSPTTPQGDPGLEPLADNGGATFTHALMPGSGPANTGNNSICAATPINYLDQRGEARPSGSRCEIGAFELKQAGGFFVFASMNGNVIVIPSG